MRVEGSRLEHLHPLMRAAVYDALGPFARRQGHAAAAEALKRRGAPAEEIAAQLLAGEPARSAENVAILRAAAEQAIAAVAPRAAVRYLARAVEEGAAEGAERRALLLDLGRWQRVTGDPGARDTLARACAESVGTPDHVCAAIELAATAYAHAENALVEQTVVAMRGVEMNADERLTLDMVHAEALWGEGRSEDSVRLIEQVPRGLPGDTPAQRMALGMAGAVRLIRGGATEEVLDMLRRSVGEDGTAPGPVAGLDLGDPLQWILQAGALDEAQALAEMRMDHARDSGDEALFAATQNSMGWLLSLRGDLHGSEAAFRLGLSNPAVSPFMRAHLVINLVETLIEHGQARRRRGGAREDPRGPLPVGGGGGPRAARRVRPLARRIRGRPARASRRSTAEASSAALRRTRTWPGSRRTTSTASSGSGAAARPRRSPGSSSRAATQLGVDFGLGVHGSALARATGDLGDHARAVGVLAASPYRWHEARARLEYGAALRRAGQRVQAREQLRLALDYCERNGVLHLAERARDELKVSGARLRTDAERSGAAALTPAENRIARLAAEGMSNKEIAQHLFVTVGTVQTTLVRVYRKLDIGGPDGDRRGHSRSIAMAP